jgi:hypothetical protein
MTHYFYHKEIITKEKEVNSKCNSSLTEKREEECKKMRNEPEKMKSDDYMIRFICVCMLYCGLETLNIFQKRFTFYTPPPEAHTHPLTFHFYPSLLRTSV